MTNWSLQMVMCRVEHTWGHGSWLPITFYLDLHQWCVSLNEKYPQGRHKVVTEDI